MLIGHGVGYRGRPKQCLAVSRQEGVALVISLIVLVVLTLIGLVALRTTLLESRSTANAIDITLASRAAEVGLREAETWLFLQEDPPSCQSGCSDFAVMPITDNNYSNANEFLGLSDADWQALANESTIRLESTSLPTYFVIRETDAEEGYVTDEADFYTYEITAIGYGQNRATRYIVQSTFMRHYQDSNNGRRRTWRYLRAE